MKKKVKIIGGGVLGLLAAAGVALSAAQPLDAATTTLFAATANITFTEQGNYVYDRSMVVYPQISGEVLEIRVQPGDTVQRGDVLATVSARDYEFQIKGLESSIAGYKAQIQDLYVKEQENKSAMSETRETLLGQIAEIDYNIKDYDKEQKSLARQIELQEEIIQQNAHMEYLAREDYRDAKDRYDHGDGDMTQAEFNAVREAYNAAQTATSESRKRLEEMKTGKFTKQSLEAQRDSLESQLGVLGKRMETGTSWAMQQYYNTLIQSAQQNIESMTEKLGQADIAAPMDGVIDKLPVRDTNLVSQSQSVATICADPAVEVFVPIREIDSVQVGDTVDLILDKRLGNETISGKVIRIEDEAQVRVSALGVEERKVRVLITPQEKLNIGYAMDVRFTVLEQPDAIVAPKTAVFEKDGKDMVWIVENGKAALREIQKGAETREGYMIASGLVSGDVIITDANIEGLSEGKNIK